MKISTIMVCRNSEATIGEAIESWIMQTYSDRELLVVDGNSTDRTCAIVMSFQNPLIRLWSEPDSGIYDAINKGISRSSGDVIGLLHSNDRFAHEEVLGTIAKAFEDPILDAIYSDVVFVDFDRPDKVLRRYKSARFEPRRIAWGVMPAHTSLHFRRHVFETYGLYRTDYRIAGDFEFVARVFRDGSLKARYAEDDWIIMSRGGLSTSGLGAKFTINCEVMRACRENDIETNIFKIISKYPAKLWEVIRP